MHSLVLCRNRHGAFMFAHNLSKPGDNGVITLRPLNSGLVHYTYMEHVSLYDAFFTLDGVVGYCEADNSWWTPTSSESCWATRWYRYET